MRLFISGHSKVLSYVKVHERSNEGWWTFCRKNLQSSFTKIILERRKWFFLKVFKKYFNISFFREWFWTFIRVRSWTWLSEQVCYVTFTNVHEWTEGSRRSMNNLHEQERRELLIRWPELYLYQFRTFKCWFLLTFSCGNPIKIRS